MGQDTKALDSFQQIAIGLCVASHCDFGGGCECMCQCSCTIEEGMCTHELIVGSGWDSDVFLGSSLVDIYTQCGSMDDAQRVFNKSIHIEMWSVELP
jgi:hypothetical protein